MKVSGYCTYMVFFSVYVLSPAFIIGIDDLFDVKKALQPVTERWKHIGLALRLDPNELKVIERENRGNLEDCLTEVLTLWLKKAYNTERFGEPSWELLARAVAHPDGGNNPALAEKIAKKWYMTSKIKGGVNVSLNGTNTNYFDHICVLRTERTDSRLSFSQQNL